MAWEHFTGDVDRFITVQQITEVHAAYRERMQVRPVLWENPPAYENPSRLAQKTDLPLLINTIAQDFAVDAQMSRLWLPERVWGPNSNVIRKALSDLGLESAIDDLWPDQHNWNQSLDMAATWNVARHAVRLLQLVQVLLTPGPGSMIRPDSGTHPSWSATVSAWYAQPLEAGSASARVWSRASRGQAEDPTQYRISETGNINLLIQMRDVPPFRAGYSIYGRHVMSSILDYIQFPQLTIRWKSSDQQQLTPINPGPGTPATIVENSTLVGTPHTYTLSLAAFEDPDYVDELRPSEPLPLSASTYGGSVYFSILNSRELVFAAPSYSYP